MSLAFNAASVSNFGAGVTSLTWSHTTSGLDRALIVGVSYFDAAAVSITGVTYAGVAMTNIGGATDSSNSRAQLWKLSNPAVGANNVIVSFSGGIDGLAGAVSFTGAQQITALLTGTLATATGSNTTPTVNAVSNPAEIVIDTLVTAFNLVDATAGAGQTERWKVFNGPCGAGSTEAGATSTTMSWTLSSSSPWALIAIAVKPKSSGVFFRAGVL